MPQQMRFSLGLRTLAWHDNWAGGVKCSQPGSCHAKDSRLRTLVWHGPARRAAYKIFCHQLKILDASCGPPAPRRGRTSPRVAPHQHRPCLRAHRSTMPSAVVAPSAAIVPRLASRHQSTIRARPNEELQSCWSAASSGSPRAALWLHFTLVWSRINW